jgi:arylsulfatase
LDRVFLITPATDIVGKFLMTFKDFPASQTAGSFNLTKMQKQIEESGKVTR